MTPLFRKALLGIFGGGLILGGLAACAHRSAAWGPGASASPEFRARLVAKVSGKLDLDAGQEQKLAVLAEKLQAQRAAVRGDGEPGAMLRGVLAGDRLDQAGAARLVEAKTSAVREGSADVIAAAADFFDNLRPGQQEKVRGWLGRVGRWRS